MTFSDDLDIRITDSTLRDGSHAVGHRFTEDQVRRVVRELDAAGVPVIEVSHGDGLGGSSYVYGRSATDELRLVAAAVEEAGQAKIAALMLPGVGTVDDIRAVHDAGAAVIRIATHCSEADISQQHFGLARAMGMETVGFLMLAHRLSPEALARQARIMADAGCQCVYVTDSAGALILDEVSDRVQALLAEVGGDAQVGFHGHQNLSLAVANTASAFRAGAVQVDGCTRGLGAGAGNTPTEALVAVCDRLGLRTGVDAFSMMRVAEEVVRPIMDAECVTDRLSLAMGYGGVYSSFMRHAAQAATRYGVDPAEILLECGRRKLVGGQEDQITSIALELAHDR
ncbi:4-hydroxy-2-oxovalerate aldolase [Nonomuraea sp. LPB2021202275-12-8]|uniref:4-hydroxy-2-oxovalerate aldolase n=1 Tax=Nonomuraea sp. LPB2021202275-12-8 TaxID=3120159 RepID=UPI00300C13C6